MFLRVTPLEVRLTPLEVRVTPSEVFRFFLMFTYVLIASPLQVPVFFFFAAAARRASPLKEGARRFIQHHDECQRCPKQNPQGVQVKVFKSRF